MVDLSRIEFGPRRLRRQHDLSIFRTYWSYSRSVICIVYRHLERGNSHHNKTQADEELGLLDRIPDRDRNHAIARAEMSTSGAEVVTNGPQTDPGDSSGSCSARANVRDGQRYDALVHSNTSFRGRSHP
jgi:hypothetical protein